MKRRAFLKFGTALAAAGAAATPALAQGTRELKLVSAWSEFDALNAASLKRLVHQIETLSSGQLSVKIAWAAEGASPSTILDTVARGEADLYFAAEPVAGAPKSPGYALLGALHFGMLDAERQAWLDGMDGGGIWHELAAGFNIVPLAAGGAAPSSGLLFKKDITSTADFKGLRCRSGGTTAALLEHFGATSTAISEAEAAKAFIDGGLDVIRVTAVTPDAANLFAAAKFIVWPGVEMPAPLQVLGANLNVWKSLPDAKQTILRMACAENSRQQAIEVFKANAEALARFAKTGKFHPRRFPPKVLTALAKASDELLAGKMKSAGETERRLHASYLSARAKLTAWTRHGEEPFFASRRLPYRYGQPVQAATPNLRGLEPGARIPSPLRKLPDRI